MRDITPLASPKSSIDYEWTCPDCGQIVKPLSGDIAGKAVYLRLRYCPCPVGQELSQMAKTMTAQAISKKMIADSGLLTEERAQTLASYNPSSRNLIEGLRKFNAVKMYCEKVEFGGNNFLVIDGKYGLGKTHLAIGAAQYLAEKRGWSIFLVNWASLLSEIKSSWGTKESGQAEQAFSAKVKSRRIVIFDDLDKGDSPSAWAMTLLYGWINERIRRGLPTIITANRELGDEFGKSKHGGPTILTYWQSVSVKDPEKQASIRDHAEAIHSRIVGAAWGEITLLGNDYRKMGR